jgi:D-psicose/D-tagatose/L-ribulose 3-epimerase
VLKYGTHTFVWIDEWSKEKGNRAIVAAADLGFDFIEVSLTKPDEFDASDHRDVLSQTGMRVTTSLVLPAWAHMPENPNGAKEYLTRALDMAESINSTYLCGCIAYALGRFGGSVPVDVEKRTIVNTLGEVALDAKRRGICLGIEVVNRYESHLYNTLADARQTILAIGLDNVKIHVDTYHMNYEEAGFYQPLVDCRDVLGYVHMSENHRGRLGSGTIQWDEVFRGLSDADYSGPLVLKCFAAVNPDLATAIKLWRPPQESPRLLAAEGLRFLRERAERFGLPIAGPLPPAENSAVGTVSGAGTSPVR